MTPRPSPKVTLFNVSRRSEPQSQIGGGSSAELCRVQVWGSGAWFLRNMYESRGQSQGKAALSTALGFQALMISRCKAYPLGYKAGQGLQTHSEAVAYSGDFRRWLSFSENSNSGASKHRPTLTSPIPRVCPKDQAPVGAEALAPDSKHLAPTQASPSDPAFTARNSRCALGGGGAGAAFGAFRKQSGFTVRCTSSGMVPGFFVCHTRTQTSCKTQDAYVPLQVHSLSLRGEKWARGA